MLIGYARVSTEGQSLDSQLDALKAYGCERIYCDKKSGAEATNRLNLQRMLDTVRKGDVVVVHRLDRLGRSTRDLIELIGQFEKKGVGFRSLSENLDTTGAMGRLIFQIFAALAEFERNIISDRTKAGLEAAKARGRLGGRRPALTEKQRQQVAALHSANTHTLKEIASLYSVSTRTISNVVRDMRVLNGS